MQMEKFPLKVSQIIKKPNYKKEDLKLITDLEGTYNEEGWAYIPERRAFTPSYLIWSVVRKEHRKRHWGAEALYKHLFQDIIARN